MLKIGSLKRSIETNKIQKDELMEKVKKRKKKRQNNIRNEKWSLSSDAIEIRQTLWKFYGNKFVNLHRMNKFLEKVNLPKLTQEDKIPSKHRPSRKLNHVLIIFP